MENLTITILQPDITWENKTDNIRNYQSVINHINDSDIIILPEMFTTGFSMSTELLAEDMSGMTVNWMSVNAVKRKSVICGSVIIKDGGKYYNRFIWVQPDGLIATYDKKNLFSYAGETNHYTPGDKKIVIDYKGWKICPQICYDLRFPVWARNKEDYDILLYVANWPESRSEAWKTLLKARAIENQCYVIGVNRVGYDGNGLSYSGDSCIIDAFGTKILEVPKDLPNISKKEISKKNLIYQRQELPFLKDIEKFNLI